MNSVSTPTPTQSAAKTLAHQASLEAAFASEVGIYHDINEDCCTHIPAADNPLFCAVADGVGGGAFGDVASHALVRHCAAATPDIYRDPSKLIDWLQQSDAVVRDAIARRGDRPGASTLVAVWFLSASRAHLTNIGDCRAYRLSPRFGGGWRIEQLTTDQTYANLGSPSALNVNPNDPARMSGVGAVGTPPVLPIHLRAGELLLLCSDGLHKFVSDAELLRLCTETAANACLAERCQTLVHTAKQNGSHDDVSALLIRRNSLWHQASLPYWLALLTSALLFVTRKLG
jgi:protein phosphatase